MCIEEPLRRLLDEARAVWRGRAVLAALTRRELVARHAASAGGVLWAFVQPLLTVAAYILVFDLVFAMRLGEGAPAPRVGMFLVVGSLPWMAFGDALGRGMTSLVDAGGLLQKNALPVVLFVARSVFASTLVFAPLIVLMALAYAPLHRFAPALAALVPLLVMQILLTLLLAYVLAIFAAALRDTIQLVGFLLSVGIFLSPVLFPANLFPEAWRWVLYANPMTGFVLGYQAIVLQGAWPGAVVWAVCAGWILATAAVLGVALARSRDHLVDWL